MADSRLLLTVSEACDQLRLGRTTVYQLIRDGRLPSLRVGRSRRIPAAALEQFIEQQTEVVA